MRWAARLLLILAGIVAPAVGYWIRAEATGDAKAAVDGLFYGAAVSAFLAPIFGATFRVSIFQHLQMQLLYVVAVLAGWMTVLAWGNAGH